MVGVIFFVTLGFLYWLYEKLSPPKPKKKYGRGKYPRYV